MPSKNMRRLIPFIAGGGGTSSSSKENSTLSNTIDSKRSCVASTVSNSAIENVIQYLNNEEISFQTKDTERNSDILVFSLGGDNASYNIVMDVSQEHDIFIIYIMVPMKVPELKRSCVSEYLTRANYGIIIGNFELDFRDGEVRFKCSTQFDGSNLSSEMIEQMFGKSLYSVEHYFPGLMRLIFADMSAVDAIRLAEPGQAEGEGGAIEAIAVQVLSEPSESSPSTEQDQQGQEDLVETVAALAIPPVK